MKARALNAFFLLIGLTAASGRDTIAYSSGPSFQIPSESVPGSIDLNRDGIPDLFFWSPGQVSIMNFPSSVWIWPFDVGAVGTNQMLIVGYDAFLQSFGAEIGGDAPSGAAWSTPSFYAGLTALWWNSAGQVINGQIVYDGWSGALGDLGVAYLGVRFYAANGTRYGWVRVRLPNLELGPGGLPLELAPAIVDWACETRPNKPIRAGDIDSTRESVQFTVEFLTPRPGPRHPAQVVGTGSFILTGNTLRGELSLAGQFSSAQILDSNHPRATERLVSDFGQPLVSTSGHTAFFHDATLTPSQFIQLLHGACCVTIDDGALAARILPLAAVRDDRGDKR